MTCSQSVPARGRLLLMLSRRILATAVIAWLTAALGGCCCVPPLSCRYGEPGCPGPQRMLADCGCGGGGVAHGITGHADANCDQRGHLPLPLVAHLGWHSKEPVPTKQHYDYVSPSPKFHPLPTRPVFEPLPEYPPPHPLAGPEPRRRFIHESHLLHHWQQGQPHPAQPISAEPRSGEPHPARSPQPPAE